MTLERLGKTKAAKDEWNGFVRTSPAGSVFATTAYLDSLAVEYDLWVVRNGSGIDAGLPLVRGIFGLYTNPLYCKYLGLLPGPDPSQKASTITSTLYGRAAQFSELITGNTSFS